MKVVVSGGGTGGHTLPTLAVINSIRKIDGEAKIIFIGSRFGMESRLIPKMGIKYYGISAGKFRRYHKSNFLNFIDITTFFNNFVDFFRFIKGIFEAREVLSHEKPDVIFAKGGYVSLPVGIAAKIAKIPLVVHESDIVMGMANKKMSQFAQKVCITFPEGNYPDISEEKIVRTGNPIREDIFGGNRERFFSEIGFEKDKKTILILGGSQGSLFLNELFSEIIEKILRKYQVIWVAGERDIEVVKYKISELPSDLQKNVKVYGFINTEIADVYASSDIFIGRSGSNVIFELAAHKLPAIFIPLGSSAKSHQFENARAITRSGAAYMFKENNLDSKKLLHQIEFILNNEAETRTMSEKIGEWADLGSSDKVARVLLEVGENYIEKIRSTRKK